MQKIRTILSPPLAFFASTFCLTAPAGTKTSYTDKKGAEDKHVPNNQKEFEKFTLEDQSPSGRDAVTIEEGSALGVQFSLGQ